MKKTLFFAFSFALLAAAPALAETLRGIVENRDAATGILSVVRTDTSEEPRRIEIAVGRDTLLSGADSAAAFEKGTEISAEAEPSGERWAASSLTLVGDREETARNLRAAKESDPAAPPPASARVERPLSTYSSPASPSQSEPTRAATTPDLTPEMSSSAKVGALVVGVDDAQAR